MDTEFLLSIYLGLVSRLLVISEPVFRYGLQLVSEAENVNQAQVLETIVNAMRNRHVDTHPERQKIIAIALLKLMSTGEQVSQSFVVISWLLLNFFLVLFPKIILHNICGIFLCVTETLNDITKTDLNGATIE